MNVARAQLVARTLGEVLGAEVSRGLGLRKVLGGDHDSEGGDAQRRRARAVRHALERLGPLYVKVGQILSTRPDLVPEYMIEEFEHLHAKVSAKPFSEFEPVLRAEMGDDWKRYFGEFHTDPLGTASLAQVYKATLRSGREAVVKVQRPRIRQEMFDDMALLQKLVSKIAKVAPDFNDVMDLDAILSVVFGAMRPELDFTLEAENMDDFRRRAADFDTLSIPEVLFVTPRVLVQSLAPGHSIRDVNVEKFSPEQRENIGKDLLAFMMWGYFADRQFHADPHPGNVFISDDGQANLIDWGMVARIDRNLSNAIMIVLLAIDQNDGTMLARTWIEMGRATRRADIAGFINDMGRFVPGIAGQSLERFNFGVQLTNVLKYSSRRGIATPPMVAMLGKSFANIEGSVRYLTPGLSLTSVFKDEFKMIAQELARDLVSRDTAFRVLAQGVSMAFNAPGQTKAVLTDLANRDLTMIVGEEMGKRSRKEDRADRRLRRGEKTALAAALAGYWLHRRQPRA